MDKETIDEANRFVNSFRAYDPTTNSKRKISFDYCVPSIRRIHYSQHKKDLESVKPSTLEYIIFYLHNAEPKMIEDAIIALFYYWKVRMQNRRKLKEVYNRVLEHYTRANSNDDIPLAKTMDTDSWLYNEYVVYSIGFFIGSIKVNKFGLTSDKNRYKNLFLMLELNTPPCECWLF